ncbi:hypothetical protein GLW08_11840 [Pontibacillus yanchengensis]|uniref:Uncharacterized protein n=2 Tax=Pontibacillus yanchengensis TaxID=462910 RepID=A0A6I5A5B2_9BACI|nr:hypothetical protein [Pontibacillus yanchengensis]MYL35541.1 hypothetical protein [Pontibacillus yanchengensis]MYL54029.1 hypothetical protein [Pontibacillus yanchengensis]
MKTRILDRFSTNKKWKDYINIRSFECKASLIISILLVFAFYLFDMYGSFDTYVEVLQDITLNIIQALISLLGIIIAGVAIIFSALNKEVLATIKKINPTASIQTIFISFEFLAFNIGIGIMIFLLLHFSLYTSFELVPEIVFYILLSFFLYFFTFIIFYAISLISNIIRLFYITDTYSNINDYENSVHYEANEIRIDFILNSIMKDRISKEEFIKQLFEFVERSNSDNKEEVKKYFRDYYS